MTYFHVAMNFIELDMPYSICNAVNTCSLCKVVDSSLQWITHATSRQDMGHIQLDCLERLCEM